MAIPAILTQAIYDVAPTAVINLGPVNGRYAGTVVAEEFVEMTHLERQTAIWRSIHQGMGPNAGTVGTLLLYSPDEADAVEADDEE